MTTDHQRALDELIRKGRVHLYKPIQIAEILRRDRIMKDIELSKIETYRNPSRKWRDEVSVRLVGSVSTSNSRYQDDIFRAVTPINLVKLGRENRTDAGGVEARIYRALGDRWKQLSGALAYCEQADPESFILQDFLGMFSEEPGLVRSVDKILEAVTYAILSLVLEELHVTVRVTVHDERGLGEVFSRYLNAVLGLGEGTNERDTAAAFFRVGVANAADRGLDLVSNFGPIVQVKHLALTERLAERIAEVVQSDQVVIVCRSADAATIRSIFEHPDLSERVQAILTEADLAAWYEHALNSDTELELGVDLLDRLRSQLRQEFPHVAGYVAFMEERGYGLA